MNVQNLIFIARRFGNVDKLLSFQVLEIAIKSVVVDGSPTELIGKSVIVASQLQDSTGTVVVPLTKDMIPVGQLLGNMLLFSCVFKMLRWLKGSVYNLETRGWNCSVSSRKNQHFECYYILLNLNTNKRHFRHTIWFFSKI